MLKEENLNLKRLAQTGVVVVLSCLVSFSIWKIFHNVSLDPSKVQDSRYFFIPRQSFIYGGISLFVIMLSFFILEKKRKQVFYIFLFIPCSILLAGKGLALIAVTIFLLASIGLGIAFYNLFYSLRKLDIEKAVVSLFLGVSINSIVIWTAMHYKVNYPFTYYFFFLLETFIFRKQVIIFIEKAMEKLNGGHINWGQKIIVLSGVFFIFYALVPYYLADDIARHLYIPKYVFLNGYWDFRPDFVHALDLAIIPYGSYTAVFLMGGEYAIRILNYLFFFVGAVLLENFTRKMFGSRGAVIAVSLCVFTPFLLWEFGVVFIDNFVFTASIAVFSFLFYLLQNLEHKRAVVFFFTLCAFAFLCKLQFIFLLIPLVVVLLVFFIKKVIETRNYSYFSSLFLGGIIFLLILSPFLLHNYHIAKNPFFPYFNEFFKSEWYDPENYRDDRWKQPLNWKTLYDITFLGSKYIENINYSFGISYFVFLVFSPILFFVKAKRKEIAIIVFTFIVAIYLWSKTTNPYMRYYIHILPLGSIILALTIDKLLEWNRDNKIRSSMILIVFVLVCIANFLCQLSIGNVTTPYPLREAFGRYYEKTGDWTERRKVFDFARVKYGEKAKGLLIDSWGLYFADFTIEGDWISFYQNHKNIFLASRNAAEMYNNIFVKRKFDFIIMPNSPQTGNVQNPILNSSDFKGMLNKEFSAMEYVLYSPKKKMILYPPKKAELLKEEKVLFDFSQLFRTATLEGNERADIPWKETIAVITVPEEDNKKAIFAAPDSSMAYRITLPNRKNILLKTSIGYHPISQGWDSDGLRMKIVVSSKRYSKVILDEYIMPREGFIDAKLSLDEFAGENVVIKLSTTNDPGKNGNGDWAVWLEPKIL
jgi:hypothetical protein